MKITTRKWDASEYLDSSEMIREYLEASFEEGDSEQLLSSTASIGKGNRAVNKALTSLAGITKRHEKHGVVNHSNSKF